MAKSKFVKANEKIARNVTAAFGKIEDTVVGGYTKIEDGRDIRISAKEVEKLLPRLLFFTQKQQGGRTTP